MALFIRQLIKCFRPNTAPVNNRGPATVQHRPTRAKYAPRPGRLHATPAYVLVVDQSNSTSKPLRMAFGRRTTRIEAIRLASERYIQQLAASNPRQLVAVVGFSDTSTLWHPLAPAGPAIRSLLQSLRSLLPLDFTNLSAGLASALGQLRQSGTTRGNIVLITDGAANVEKDRLPSLVQEARARRVRIFTIGVGNDGDSEYDMNLLVHMAGSTGGRFTSAHSFEALCNALRRAC